MRLESYRRGPLGAAAPAGRPSSPTPSPASPSPRSTPPALDFAAMLAHARSVGGPALRRLYLPPARR